MAYHRDRSKATAPLPFLHVVYSLFFQPSVLAQVRTRSIITVLVFVTMLSLGCGFVLALSRSPTLHRTVRAWHSWLMDDVRTFGLRDGQLYWEAPADLPYTTEVAGWQIDFRDNGEFANERPELIAERGVWINRKTITLWYRQTHPTSFFGGSEMRISEQDIGPLLFPLLRHDGPFSGAKLDQLVTTWQIVAYIMLLLGKVTLVFFTIGLLPVFYAFLFWFSPALTRSTRKRAINQYCTLYLYSSIPPLLVATIYASLNIPGLNFFIVYHIAFFIYYTYLSYTFRRLGLTLIET